RWTVSANPHNRDADTDLNAVAAASRHDIWAVGGGGITDSSEIMEHWDGGSWKLRNGPKLPLATGCDRCPTTASLFRGVAVLSSGEAWAVGYNVGRPLIEHWAGKD